MKPGEVKQANIQGYNAGAAEYDQNYLSLIYDRGIETTRLRKLLANSNVPAKRHYPMVLEIGVGTGIGSAVVGAVTDIGGLYALDISREMIKRCREKNAGLNAVVSDAEFSGIRCDAVDIVFCRSFVHHLPSDDAILREAHRILRTGGLFILLKEPLMGGCDLWFRLKHIPMRYGDRNGLALLWSRLADPRKWRELWNYEMSAEEFVMLDKQEIRGAVLHSTPLKVRGGVNLDDIVRKSRGLFRRHASIKYGFFESLIECCEILFRVNMPIKRVVARIDYVLAALFSKCPFESFMLVLEK